MSDIEWTDVTWNPVTGCSRVSSGCDNCYAMRMARRLDGRGMGYDDTTRYDDGVDWSGVIHTHEDRLEDPLSWKKPRRVFVCSMSDLFHPRVPFEFIDKVFAIMALAQAHTFQLLTKRPERMEDYLTGHASGGRHVWDEAQKVSFPGGCPKPSPGWPLPNVWLGVSVENQENADDRIPSVLQCPAAVRFLSAEPLLGPIRLEGMVVDVPWMGGKKNGGRDYTPVLSLLDWIIVGGESGHGARPMHPEWIRDLRDQCDEAGVSFFFKQWGRWKPHIGLTFRPKEYAGQLFEVHSNGEGIRYHAYPPDSNNDPGEIEILKNVGKGDAGRTLDGETYDEFPDLEPAYSNG